MVYYPLCSDWGNDIVNEFQPISDTSRLSEKVFQQIKASIAAGKYKAGDKLPSENQMTDIFQISRTSVREAMKLLTGQGLIVVKRGVGSYVAEHEEHPYVTDLQNILSREKNNILELFQIRNILDTEAAAWAAQKASPADLEKMTNLLDQAEVLAQNPKGNRQILNRVNSEFHSALIEATGNHTLLKMMNGLIGMLTDVRDITLQLPGRSLGSVAGHREVLHAIKHGDSERARISMAKHLEAIEFIIINYHK